LTNDVRRDVRVAIFGEIAIGRPSDESRVTGWIEPAACFGRGRNLCRLRRASALALGSSATAATTTTLLMIAAGSAASSTPMAAPVASIIEVAAVATITTVAPITTISAIALWIAT